jgi:hypothetical protein
VSKPPNPPKLRVHRKLRKAPRKPPEPLIDPRTPTMPAPHTRIEGGTPRPGVYRVEVAKVEVKDGRIVQTLRRVRSPVDPALSWHRQRNLWNAEGFCPRAACGEGRGGPRPHNHRRHPESGLDYCDRCADRIEAANTDLGLLLPRTTPTEETDDGR